MSPAASKESDSKDEIKVTKSEKRKKSDINMKSEKSEQPKEKQVKKESDIVKLKKEDTAPSLDVYEQILQLESQESETRSGETDLHLWRNTCGELRNLMKDIFELKIKNNSPSDVSEKRIQASLLFVTLKKLNRLEKLRYVVST